MDNSEKGEIVAEVGADDLFQYDGFLIKNASRFKRTKTIEIMVAIDPDLDDAPLEATRQADDNHHNSATINHHSSAQQTTLQI